SIAVELINLKLDLPVRYVYAVPKETTTKYNPDIPGIIDRRPELRRILASEVPVDIRPLRGINRGCQRDVLAAVLQHRAQIVRDWIRIEPVPLAPPVKSPSSLNEEPHARRRMAARISQRVI